MSFSRDTSDAITEPTQKTGPFEVWQEKLIKQIQCQHETTTHNRTETEGAELTTITRM